MHRCRPTPSSPSPMYKSGTAVAKAAHVVPFGSPEGVSAATRYFTVMFNNSQTARWREKEKERAPYRLSISPSTPFELFRRLISCLVEDVVVAISFASRGAWATSSMKWTTCLSYRIWLTKWVGVILLWTFFFLFFFLIDFSRKIEDLAERRRRRLIPFPLINFFEFNSLRVTFMYFKELEF